MLLEIKDISKQYPKTLALDHFSAELTSGLYGLLGPNGAGKTTLISIITTLLSPSSGTVLYNGKPIGGRDYMKILGYLPQYPRFYKDFTAQEFLLYMSSMKGLKPKAAAQRVKDLLEQVNLTEHKNKRIGSFSGGMRQRLGIAQAILNDHFQIVKRTHHYSCNTYRIRCGMCCERGDPAQRGKAAAKSITSVPANRYDRQGLDFAGG